MNQISFKKILILFLVLLLMSKTGKILQLFSSINTDGLLTLEPLSNSPVGARFLVTLALFALLFTTIFLLLNKRK